MTSTYSSCKIPFFYNGRQSFHCQYNSGLYKCNTHNGIEECADGRYLGFKTSSTNTAASFQFNIINLNSIESLIFEFYILFGCDGINKECIDSNDTIAFLINDNLVSTYGIIDLDDKINVWIKKSFEYVPTNNEISIRLKFKRSINRDEEIVFGLDNFLIKGTQFY